MVRNEQASLALGTLGAVFWSVQLVPQIIKSYRRKTTIGLSFAMMASWSFAAPWLGAYAIIVSLNTALIVQPQLFLVFASATVAQWFYYDKRWPLRKLLPFMFAFYAAAAGLQVGLVYAARSLERDGNQRLTQFIGVVSLLAIVLAFGPQFYEIARYRAVFGISLIFLSIDALGGLVSFLSLVFEPPIDALAAVNYLSVVAAELAIFALVPLMNRGKDVTKLHEALLEKAELERADAMTLKARQQPVLARRPSSHRPVQSDE